MSSDYRLACAGCQRALDGMPLLLETRHPGMRVVCEGAAADILRNKCGPRYVPEAKAGVRRAVGIVCACTETRARHEIFENWEAGRFLRQWKERTLLACETTVFARDAHFVFSGAQ